MGKLSQYARKRIISLHSSGINRTKIQKALDQEGIKTSRSAISLFLSRYSRTDDIGDAPRSGRNAKLAPEAIAYIEEKMQENDELTSRELKEKMANECDIQISEATIRRVRRKLGWKVENARYCQLVCEPNKIKRMAFCLKAFTEKDMFKNVIFMDETSVQMEQYARVCFHKDGTQPKRKGCPKHPLKVHVWAGISWQGATQVCIFSGCMESIGYQTILERNLLPFVRRVYPDGHRMWQDNDQNKQRNR
ncbi:Transposable element Tcb2 transposase [Paramuricea clavata]|uniref:Transposable element Tcb2 transposase n=1 Tax=Paramuricea clavata TaxID=317549 RepID=A0A7D9LEK6_PARCT|nr:Transposable element Tcb2 transposase [Paramuricea clavata]